MWMILRWRVWGGYQREEGASIQCTHGMGMFPSQKRVDWSCHEGGFDLDLPAPIPTRHPGRFAAGVMVEDVWFPMSEPMLGWWVPALLSTTWT